MIPFNLCTTYKRNITRVSGVAFSILPIYVPDAASKSRGWHEIKLTPTTAMLPNDTSDPTMTSVQADVEKFISKMKKGNTTNPRALRELKRRAEPIAAHLDRSKDAAQ